MAPNLPREFGEGDRPRIAPCHTVSVVVHHSKFGWLMSAKGHERPICGARAMSALPQKATGSLHFGDRRKGPDLPIGA